MDDRRAAPPPSCALEPQGQLTQAERYRRAGAGASIVERTPRRVVVTLSDEVDVDLVDELVAVERRCCPFFTLDWAPRERRLAVSVASSEEAPAVDAIAFALGLDEERAVPAP